MQTSEHLVAYQTVSFSAYQRLKETLVQQAHVFETIVSASQGAHTQSVNDDLFVADYGVEDYVLMSSSKLNVLLTATPVGSEIASEVACNASDQLPSGQKNRWMNDHHAMSADKKSTDRHGAVSRSQAQPSRYSSNDKQAQQPAYYRVGLTFDDRAIAVFIDRLKGNSAHASSAGHSVGITATESNFINANSIGSYQSQGHFMTHQNTVEESVGNSIGSLSETFDSTPNISDDDKIIAQKSFVLTWAKNLATSPDGDSQPSQEVLDNQLQQSLLLDQVITRIRHSLDLSAILETTVAQVREFLSADRLVLYQFDKFSAESALSETMSEADSLSDKLASALENLSSGAISVNDFSPQEGSSQVSSTGARIKQSSGLSSDAQPSPEMPQLDPSKVGRSTHAGHVTYESRASESISSVLHIAENECFESFAPLRSKYLTGHPIAIDNVDQRYGHAPCLLNFLKQAAVKSKIIAPVIVQGELWGLLIAHQCEDYRHWEEAETVFLQHIAEHLAVAIAQSSLYQQLRQQTVSLESCVIERTQSLHDALMAAESANITKGEFLSTMSHELRTPLTYIIGMSATLLRWSFGDLNERQRSYLNTINHSGEQLLSVINNILEFASIESGQSLLDFSELSLTQLMHTIVSQHQDMADKQAVTLCLDCDISAGGDRIYADARRLQQILSNLLHNAIKFTGEGGTVSIRGWRSPTATVLQVEDTGIGIPASQKDVLFETFKQLEPPIHRQYSGTGLGLAMTKRLVELHGGTIQVESQLNKGSTFTVQLPDQRKLMSSHHYQVPIVEDSAKRIILLEKDEENAAIVCEMLTAAGYEVIWLIDADDMAKQLELLRPIILIADLSLIHADASSIKATQLAITALNAKVLALANRSDSAPSSVAHHDTLHKPIDPKTLLEKVRQLLFVAA